MSIYDSCRSVLIIGNGFDRNCGLKTSFLNVYDEYLKVVPTNDLIKTFKKDINSDKDNWADFEFRMSEYAKHFSSEDEFIECLDDFSTFMHKYLLGVQSSFFNDWKKMKIKKNTISSFRSSLNNLGFGVTHNIDSFISINEATNASTMGFISLNYTDILDTLLNSTYGINISSRVVHVHGLLGDDPVLGMDREEQLDISYPVSERLKRHFIKPYFNNEYDRQRIINAETMINSAKFIFVYGASLDESDLSWRERLIRWLCDNKEHHLFLYFHRNEKIDPTSKPHVMDCEVAEKKRLISKWRLMSTDDIPLERLHIPCGVKLFDLKNALLLDKVDSAKAI